MPLQLDAPRFDQPLYAHFLFQPLDLVVGDARHNQSFRISTFAAKPVKWVEQNCCGFTLHLKLQYDTVSVKPTNDPRPDSGFTLALLCHGFPD